MCHTLSYTSVLNLRSKWPVSKRPARLQSDTTNGFSPSLLTSVAPENVQPLSFLLLEQAYITRKHQNRLWHAQEHKWEKLKRPSLLTSYQPFIQIPQPVYCVFNQLGYLCSGKPPLGSVLVLQVSNTLFTLLIVVSVSLTEKYRPFLYCPCLIYSRKLLWVIEPVCTITVSIGQMFSSCIPTFFKKQLNIPPLWSLPAGLYRVNAPWGVLIYCT